MQHFCFWLKIFSLSLFITWVPLCISLCLSSSHELLKKCASTYVANIIGWSFVAQKGTIYPTSLKQGMQLSIVENFTDVSGSLLDKHEGMLIRASRSNSSPVRLCLSSHFFCYLTADPTLHARKLARCAFVLLHAAPLYLIPFTPLTSD